jgi:hypothetical protein
MTDSGLQDAEHAVIDGDREIQFTGVLLGSSSSFQPGKERWAEIYIYKTHGGTYVVAGIGRTKLAGEHDKCWAQVCEEPAAVIERLHLMDAKRGKYLPYVSREAINMARSHDDLFSVAYMIERVE